VTAATHTRTEHVGGGPDYCAECSADAVEWVSWAECVIKRRAGDPTVVLGGLTLSTEPIDIVNHPPHYTSHPSGIECIQVTEHMGFNLGNAVKYIWRADEKGKALEDLEKARWYITREIERRSRS
jgi:hypothetical protein